MVFIVFLQHTMSLSFRQTMTKQTHHCEFSRHFSMYAKIAWPSFLVIFRKTLQY